MDIVIIGAGNVATHLALALHSVGEHIVQVYSRTEIAARSLAQQLGATFTHRTECIRPDADMYIYSVCDNALPTVIDAVAPNNAIHVHTAGSIPITVFEHRQQNYGVLYPLQTFSKNKAVDFTQVPLFVEACNNALSEQLTKFFDRLSPSIHYANSADRQKIHLAAVFACNYTNHLYAIAQELLGSIPFEVLKPLIGETIEKLNTLTPYEAQTGPAVRRDTQVMQKHLQLLASQPAWQQIYQLISDDIMRQHQK